MGEGAAATRVRPAPAVVGPPVPAIVASHLLWSIVAGWLGHQDFDADGGLPDLWLLHGVAYGAFSLAVDRRDERDPSPWQAAAIVFFGFFVGSLLAGQPVGYVLLRGVANLAVAALGVAVYRFRGLGGSGVPRDAGEAIWLMVSLLVVAGTGVLVGAFPGTALGVPPSMTDASWAAARGLVVVSTVANCVHPFYYRREDSPLRWERRGLYPLYLLLCAGSLFAPIAWPDQPLSWLFILPTVVAGTTLTLRPACGAVLVMAGVAAFLPYPQFSVVPPPGFPLPQSLVDVAYAFAAHVAVLIIVFREETLRLQTRMERLADRERGQTELLDGVVESMSDGLLLLDGDGRVALANASARGLAGDELPSTMTLDWILGTGVQPGSQDREIDPLAVGEMLHPPPGVAVRRDVLVPREEESPLRIAVTSTELEGPDAGALTLVLFKDVTAAYERQTELESFASTVAHDLKGPLAALSGWMEAADSELAEDDPEAGREALRRAHLAIGRMRALIDDYLAYAVSHGGVLHLRDIPLEAVVSEIIEVYARAEGGPTFEVDVPHVVHADAALTRQLMANLIGNGIKYVREGERPYIRVLSIDDAPGWAQVQVADKGRGLPPGEEEAIFERLDRGTNRGSVGGIGLGLALCLAIVTRHGGKISAANNEWGGATFFLTLPTAADPSADAAAPTAAGVGAPSTAGVGEGAA